MLATAEGGGKNVLIAVDPEYRTNNAYVSSSEFERY
jgi:hypothetical protein